MNPDCRILRSNITLQQHWDDCIAGNPHSPLRWERPFLKGSVRVTVRGYSFESNRLRTDGNVFHLDVQLRDGRTLRMVLPPSYPCDRITFSTGPSDYNIAVALGFPKRDHDRPVTDADRLVIDLTR